LKREKKGKDSYGRKEGIRGADEEYIKLGIQAEIMPF